MGARKNAAHPYAGAQNSASGGASHAEIYPVAGHCGVRYACAQKARRAAYGTTWTRTTFGVK
jgi:hypothetical protein